MATFGFLLEEKVDIAIISMFEFLTALVEENGLIDTERKRSLRGCWRLAWIR